MGNIKLKFCTLIIFIIIFFSILISSLSGICNAEEGQADLSIIGEPTYTVTNTIVKNDKILGKTFQIDVIINNAGDIKSDEIEINLTDEEGFALTQRAYFEPNETKTISFTWSTINIRNQNIRINYYPSNLDTIWNKYNSGYKIFTIKVIDSNNPGTSTPGFEIIFLLTAIIFIIYFMKKKN